MTYNHEIRKNLKNSRRRGGLRNFRIFISIIIVLLLIFNVYSINTQNTTKIDSLKSNFSSGNSEVLSLSSITYDPGNDTELETFLDDIIEPFVQDSTIPGATISVVKGDEVLLSKGYGYADVESQKPVLPNQTLFEIGSVSKLFIWTAVMQLWEQGELELDEDINTYLDFEIPTAYSEPITLYHLMSHTAGFESMYLGLMSPEPLGENAVEEFCKSNIPALVRPPGEVASYSNYGASLAGYIVELVSGMPFEEYIEENIYKPLEMENSTFWSQIPSRFSDDLATGYSFANEDGTFNAQKVMYVTGIPAGGMKSTADDMAKFMIAHLNDGEYQNSSILKEDTAQKMHNRSFSHDPRVNGWAHGFGEWTINGRRLIAHSGGTYWFTTNFILSLEYDVGLFISISNPEGFIVINKVIDGFMDRYYPASELGAVEPLPNHVERVSKFAGKYRSPASIYTTYAKMAELLWVFTIEVTTDGIIVLPRGERYIEVEPLLFRPVDENGNGNMEDEFIVFVEDEQGRITYIMFSSGDILERLEWFEDPTLHWGIIIASIVIFFIGILFEIIDSINNKMKKKKKKKDLDQELIDAEDRGTSWLFKHGKAMTRSLSFGICGLFLLFFILILLAVQPLTYLLDEDPTLYMLFYLIFTIPIIGVILMGLLGLSVIFIWKERYWGLSRRVYYTIILILIIVLFIPELIYWDLLGFHF